jgi:hypothetical protein
MNRKNASTWVAFIFSAILSTLVLITNIVGGFLTGHTDAGMIPFIAFLPMTFYFAAAAQRQTRDEIEALEARIRQLEGPGGPSGAQLRA